jgi:hypothetical protein
VKADEINPATRLAKFLKSLDPLSSRATRVSRIVSTGRLSVADDEEGSSENNCLAALVVSYFISSHYATPVYVTYLKKIKSIVRLIVSLENQESQQDLSTGGHIPLFRLELADFRNSLLGRLSDSSNLIVGIHDCLDVLGVLLQCRKGIE